MKHRQGRRRMVALLVLAVASAPPAPGQDPPAPEASAEPAPPPPWKLDVGLSYVTTGGNSDTSSGGLDITYEQRWGVWALEGDAKGVRASDGDRRTAERYARSCAASDGSLTPWS